MAKKKNTKKIGQTSIIMWIGIMMFYAALIGPLIPKIIDWPVWAKIVLGVSMLALPLAGQLALIYRHDAKNQNKNKK